MRRVFALCLALGGLGLELRADEGTEFFEREIRPVLVEHCYECHSARSKIVKGGLLLDTRDGIRKGGDSGPSVVPGKMDESLILGALRHETFEMPPEQRLPNTVVASFEKWIGMGAPDPRDGGGAAAARTIDLAAGRQFWSYRPIGAVAVPEEARPEWSRTPIDRFIAHGWKQQKLEPAEPADRRTLIRRATFDLIGLPPTSDEIAAFLADRDEDSIALARVVERLLASPHFGERWGRHWLDLARFSESTGGGRSMLIPEAWRYRDYVVAAFNGDKPFDEFVVEQIAGDQLPDSSLAEGAEHVTATAFLALGATNYEEQDKTQLEMDVIDEQVDTLGKVFLGQTIGCARCHDHKFDPIPTADYYALAGIFRSTQTLIHDNVSMWVTKPLPVPPEIERRLARYEEERQGLEKRIAATDKELRTLQKTIPVIILSDNFARYTGRWETAKANVLAEKGYQVSRGEGKAVFDVGQAVPASGLYEVRLESVAGERPSKDVAIRVEHAGGETTVALDQTALPLLGERFVSLGEFPFAPDSKHSIAVLASEEREAAVGSLLLVPRFSLSTAPVSGGIVAAASLPGIVVDDAAAAAVGDWTPSTSVKSFVGEGYRHDAKSGKGEKRIAFSADLPQSGEYEVRLAYHATNSRAPKVPVRITHPGGEALVYVDQTSPPPIDGLFASLGRYRFANDQTAVVTLSTEGTTGFVIADAVQFLPVENAAGEAKADTAATPSPPRPDATTLTAAVDRMLALQSTIQQISASLSTLKNSAPAAPPKVPSVRDEKNVDDGYVCIRGSYKHRGAKVPRGFLQVASSEGAAQANPVLGTSGRMELARWMASRENPLTARVYVNRVWHHLFGAGLVRTVDNFGSTGETPSHPELLDFLAGRFTDEGWSTKHLIREILLSRVYRLSSQPTPAARERDPENRLLSHANRKRLDAEELYDSLLALSGGLDRSIGGETIRPETKAEYGYKFEIGRRAIYLPVFRNRLPELFGVFDFADPNTPVGCRNVTTLPTQSLFLMNNPLVLEQSRQTAKRILESESSDAARVGRLCREALGREPIDVERAAFEAFLKEPAPSREKERLDRWAALVQTLVASIDFRYLD